MLTVALAFVALGLADLVAGGLAGQVGNSARLAWAAGAAIAVQLLSLWVAGCSLGGVAFSVVFMIGVVSWLGLRLGRPSESRAGWSAIVLMTCLGLTVLAAPQANARLPDSVQSALSDSPFELLSSYSADELILHLGVLLLLMGTANGFVRAVLVASGTRFDASADTLRGGRLIGVIERWLIFALSIGGEPTAAALIVSAKSLVRFPELSSASKAAPKDGAPAPREIDYVTEYFLLGSMLSWGCALVAVLLVR